MQLHVLFERAELKAVAGGARVNQVHQEFVAPGFMVSVEFTVCSNQNQLRFACITFALYQVPGQGVRGKQVGIGGGIPIRGDATRKRGVEEEASDTAAIL